MSAGGQDLARLRQEESNKEGALRRVFFGSKQDTSGAQQQMVDLVLYLRPNIAHGSLNNMYGLVVLQSCARKTSRAACFLLAHQALSEALCACQAA